MDNQADVLIVGAGPVGLLMAIQLRRLGVSTIIIDAADKASPDFPMYGRACGMYPRTVEILDQLDLWEDLAQSALISARSSTWNAGHRVQGRGLVSVIGNADTNFPYMVNLRLKYIEEQYRQRLGEFGTKVWAPTKLVALEVDENASDEYKVKSTCASLDGKVHTVRTKYIVGCDGANSPVRRLAGISFDGSEKGDHWVRIDAVVKTNLPDARGGSAQMETHTHGHVLWVSLDHGATRIGFVLTAEMYAKYGQHMKKEDAVREAKAAVAPFELEFERVDWHTVYTVKQFVAHDYQDRERILIAGDAAHAHSSGTAQGMNVGTHDASSLAWRLGGVINGTLRAEVLANYSDERRPIAQKLIDNDRIVSTLISGRRPEKYRHREEDPMSLVVEHFHEEAQFILGLGVHYPENLLNNVQTSYPSLCVAPGYRAPDIVLYKHGHKFHAEHPTRLHEITRWNGKFHTLVFTGDVQLTGERLKSLRKAVDEDKSNILRAVDFRTIVRGRGVAFAEFLGIEQFGKAYWDIEAAAHDRYEVLPDWGALVVVRPDGILGTVAHLDEWDKIKTYFEPILTPDVLRAALNGVNGVKGTKGPVGELVSLDENNLYYKDSDAQDISWSLEEGAVSSQNA